MLEIISFVLPDNFIKSSPNMNKDWLYFFLKLGVSVVLISFIFWKLDLSSSYLRLINLKHGYLILALLVLFILQFNNTARWRAVLIAIQAKLSFWTSFRLLYIGVFFNQTLPSSVGGDAVRMYLARKEGLSIVSAINGVILERVATVGGLILLVLLTQPLLLNRIGDNAAKLVFPILAILLVFGIIILMLLDRLPIQFKGYKIIRGLGHLASDTKRLLLSPMGATVSIGLGASGNILIAIAAFFLGQALRIDLTLLDCLVLIPPVILITTIPISIAGWGVREGAMVTTLAYVGVSEGDAFIMSLLFGISILIASLPGGFIWIKGGYKRRDIVGKITAES